MKQVQKTYAMCPTCDCEREIVETWFSDTPDPRYILRRCGHSFKDSEIDFIITRLVSE